MKTFKGKMLTALNRSIAITALFSLMLIFPFGGFSQDDQSPPPTDQNTQQNDQPAYNNPTDTPPDQNDQQLDAQEAQQTAPQSQPVTQQVFYDELSPYGQWVNYGTYGYVWIPSAGPNFVPYSTEGHWVYTDNGWTWVSDYPWGWAVFHYGRWSYDPSYGWFWVPGFDWGPAWVCWRHSEGYYGWAPLMPGIDISVGYGWGNNIPENYWCFVNERYIGDRYVWRHYEPRTNNAIYIRNSTVITNIHVDNGRHITYSAGPRREDVERTLHTTIRPVPIRESAKPAQRYDQSHLHLYRPNVTSAPANVHATPQRPADIKEVPQKNVPYQQRNNNWNAAPKQETNWNRQPATHTVQQAPRQQPQRQQSQPVRSAPVRSGGGGGGRRH